MLYIRHTEVMLRTSGRTGISKKLQPWPELPDAPEEHGCTGAPLLAAANSTLAVCWQPFCLSSRSGILASPFLLPFVSAETPLIGWLLQQPWLQSRLGNVVLRTQGLVSSGKLRRVMIVKPLYLAYIYVYIVFPYKNMSSVKQELKSFFPNDIVQTHRAVAEVRLTLIKFLIEWMSEQWAPKAGIPVLVLASLRLRKAREHPSAAGVCGHYSHHTGTSRASCLHAFLSGFGQSLRRLDGALNWQPKDAGF